MLPKPHTEYLGYTLIEADRLQTRVAELGRQISTDYADSDGLVLVGVLKGSVLFMADLMRQLTVPHAIDFMDVTSYGVGVRESSGHVRILMDLSTDIEGCDVLIVEDIIDSGRTLDYVLRLLRARQPASLRVCALLNKAERREVPVPLDYVGFDIPNKFVFGYGLDIDQFYRNLPFIGVVKEGTLIDDLA
jgi:hypoxanthine phosphoribosyltransferase